MKKISFYINRYLNKTMLLKSKIGEATEQNEAKGAAKRSFAKFWQSTNTIKLISIVLLSLCL